MGNPGRSSPGGESLGPRTSRRQAAKPFCFTIAGPAGRFLFLDPLERNPKWYPKASGLGAKQSINHKHYQLSDALGVQPRI